MTVEQLSSFLNDLTAQITGFPTYEQLSSGRETSAYTSFLELPPIEITPTKQEYKNGLTGFTGVDLVPWWND